MVTAKQMRQKAAALKQLLLADRKRDAERQKTEQENKKKKPAQEVAVAGKRAASTEMNEGQSFFPSSGERNHRTGEPSCHAEEEEEEASVAAEPSCSAEGVDGLTGDDGIKLKSKAEQAGESDSTLEEDEEEEQEDGSLSFEGEDSHETLLDSVAAIMRQGSPSSKQFFDGRDEEDSGDDEEQSQSSNAGCTEEEDACWARNFNWGRPDAYGVLRSNLAVGEDEHEQQGVEPEGLGETSKSPILLIASDFVIATGAQFKVKLSSVGQLQEPTPGGTNTPPAVLAECFGADLQGDEWYNFSCPGPDFSPLEIRILAPCYLSVREDHNFRRAELRLYRRKEIIALEPEHLHPFPPWSATSKSPSQLLSRQRRRHLLGNRVLASVCRSPLSSPQEDSCPPPMRVPAEWLSLFEAAKNKSKRCITVLGGKAAGKSALLRYLANRFLSAEAEEGAGPRRDVYWLDADVGQPELTPPGFVSLSKINAPLLYSDASVSSLAMFASGTTRPGAAHGRQVGSFVHRRFLGQTTAEADPEKYLETLQSLYYAYVQCSAADQSAGSAVLLINLPGWITGLGFHLAQEIVTMCEADFLIRVNVDAERLLLLANEPSPFAGCFLRRRGPRSELNNTNLGCSSQGASTSRCRRGGLALLGQDAVDVAKFEALMMLEGVQLQQPARAAILPKELRWLRFALAFGGRRVLEDDFFPHWPLRIPIACLQLELELVGGILDTKGAAEQDGGRRKPALPANLLGSLVGFRFGAPVQEDNDNDVKDNLVFGGEQQQSVEFLGFVHSLDERTEELVLFVEGFAAAFLQQGDRLRLLTTQMDCLHMITPPSAAGYQWNPAVTTGGCCGGVAHKQGPFLHAHVLEGVETGTRVRSSRSDLKRARLQ
eukprot:g6172.t1